MGQMRLPLVLAVLFAVVFLAPTGASALPSFHECQKPVRTGVEVYRLHHISSAVACPVALELFTWEYSSEARQRALYGCSRPKPEAPGYPYLRLHRFRGYRLSLSPPGKNFTMSKGRASFEVGGTDFPLNCT
jgi:hypothetical protein